MADCSALRKGRRVLVKGGGKARKRALFSHSLPTGKGQRQKKKRGGRKEPIFESSKFGPNREKGTGQVSFRTAHRKKKWLTRDSASRAGEKGEEEKKRRGANDLSNPNSEEKGHRVNSTDVDEKLERLENGWLEMNGRLVGDEERGKRKGGCLLL